RFVSQRLPAALESLTVAIPAVIRRHSTRYSSFSGKGNELGAGCCDWATPAEVVKNMNKPARACRSAEFLIQWNSFKRSSVANPLDVRQARGVPQKCHVSRVRNRS